jgi:hypothetical protein
MSERFRVLGADGREVGVFSPSELHAFKAGLIRNADAPIELTPPQVRGFEPVPVVEPELFTIEPVNGRGEVVGQVKKWSTDVGLAAHHVAAEPSKTKGARK